MDNGNSCAQGPPVSELVFAHVIIQSDLVDQLGARMTPATIVDNPVIRLPVPPERHTYDIPIPNQGHLFYRLW